MEEDSRNSKIGLIYGIHPKEIPARQLGQLLELDGSYSVYCASENVRRSTNYLRAMKIFGVNLLLDIHSSGYKDIISPSLPRSLHTEKYFVTPSIPVKTGRVTVAQRKSFAELAAHFPVLYLTHLTGGIEYENLFHLNSNGTLSKIDTTKWKVDGWFKGVYHSVITAELWVPWDDFKNGVTDDTRQQFKRDVLTFAEWIENNIHLFIS